MNQRLDIENWNRKEHFRFFAACDEPFFGIVAEIDCTEARQRCKELGIPFFVYYLHKAILAVNCIEEFRYRIQGDGIIIFDAIHVTTTISRSDNTFAFSFIPFNKDFYEFNSVAQDEMARIKNSTGLGLTENTGRPDVIHFSAVPWIRFSGVTHPRNFKYTDSVPKITFGKYSLDNGRILMPVSVNVHHGLMDGYHVGRYLELFEKLLNETSL